MKSTDWTHAQIQAVIAGDSTLRNRFWHEFSPLVAREIQGILGEFPQSVRERAADWIQEVEVAIVRVFLPRIDVARQNVRDYVRLSTRRKLLSIMRVQRRTDALAACRFREDSVGDAEEVRLQPKPSGDLWDRSEVHRVRLNPSSDLYDWSEVPRVKLNPSNDLCDWAEPRRFRLEPSGDLCQCKPIQKRRSAASAPRPTKAFAVA